MLSTRLLRTLKTFKPTSILSGQTARMRRFCTQENAKEIPFKFTLVKPGAEKQVGWWLLLCSGGVLSMIVVGGYTRMTKSGLSMVKWKPIGYKYPGNDKEWEEEFEAYKVCKKH